MILRHTTSNAFHGGCLLLLAWSAAAFGRGDEGSLLQALAHRHLANRQAILTWWGEAEVTWQTGSQEALTARQGKLQFAWDRLNQRQAYRLDWSDNSPNSAAAGAGESPLRRQAGLLTATTYLHSAAGGLIFDSTDDWEIDEAELMRASLEARRFFPELLLSCGERTPEELWNLLLSPEPRGVELAEDPVRVEQSGFEVRITKANPIIPNVATTWTFDLSQGGQLVALDVVGPRDRTTWEYAYAQIDEIWLPTRIRYTRRSRFPQPAGDTEVQPLSAGATNVAASPDSDVGPQLICTLEIRTAGVNGGGGDDQLQAPFLGLIDGETLHDLRSGQHFSVGKEPRAAANAPPAKSEPAKVGLRVSSGRRIAVVAGWLLAMAAALRLVWGSWRKTAHLQLPTIPWWAVLCGLGSWLAVGAVAWQKAESLRVAALRDSQPTPTGQRSAFRTMRSHGIPSPMDSVLKALPGTREPSLDDLVGFLREQSLSAARRTLPFAEREQLRTPAIVELDSPLQYYFAERSPDGELLLFDLSQGRGLCRPEELAARWTNEVIEVPRDPAFVFKPTRLDADAPALQFETLYQDLGPTPPGNEVHYRFAVRNVGRAPLQLDRAYADCSCLRVENTQATIAPGERGEVVAIYDLRKRKSVGEYQHNVTVETNDPVLPYVTLTIFGNNSARMSWSPSAIEWGTIPQGEARQQPLLLAFHGDDAVDGAVVGLQSRMEHIRGEAHPIRGAEELQDLGLSDLTPRAPWVNRWLAMVDIAADAPLQESFASDLVISTNLVGYAQVRVPLQGEVGPPVRAYPATAVAASTPGPQATRGLVWLAGPESRPFTLVQIECPETELRFEFDVALRASRHRVAIESTGESSRSESPNRPFPCIATIRYDDGSTADVAWNVLLVDFNAKN